MKTSLAEIFSIEHREGEGAILTPVKGLSFWTPDLDKEVYPQQTWTRFVQGDYHPRFGFLSLNPQLRVPLLPFWEDESSSDKFFLGSPSQEEISQVINPHIVEKKLTAIHYYPGHSVQCLITGIDPDAVKTLPKHFYYT